MISPLYTIKYACKRNTMYSMFTMYDTNCVVLWRCPPIMHPPQKAPPHTHTHTSSQPHEVCEVADTEWFILYFEKRSKDESM